MNANIIDSIFDMTDEGNFSKSGLLSWWGKRWVVGGILFVLSILAGIVTALVRPKGVATELVFGVTLAALIFVFCIFLVWMTYRRAHRSDRKQEAHDLAIRALAQFYREKRQKGRVK